MQAAPTSPGRLLMTAFGWNDSGGGTTVPRLAAKELARRGWDVTVFHAAVQPTASRTPYELVEWEQDGVRLIGVHNRSHLLFDFGHPLRELDDPPITRAFNRVLGDLAPDVVHFHNLHNLGASLLDQPAAHGLPSYFTTHNYWLLCPRAYLLTGQMSICPGPGDGARCAACVGSTDVHGHQQRLAEIRARAHSGLTRILAVSEAVRAAFLGLGYDPELIDVVRQAMPHEAAIWDEVGRDRRPGRLRERLTVAFLGSAYPHKGPQLLIEAAQRTTATLDVRILGEVPQAFAQQLRQMDARGVVRLDGSFAPDQIGELLRDVDVVVLPSMWWDCAPLVAAECLAARTPLLVPRLGGLPEAIREDVDGLIFRALDAEDLARQLDRLASEPGLLDRLQSGITEPRAFSSYVDELEAYYSGQRSAPQADGAVSGDTAVRWQGDHGLPTSLSIINTQITERLDPPLQRVNAEGSAADPPLPHPAAVEVRHQWPPSLSAPGSGRLAAIVPWEFGSVPKDWVQEINRNVDELWVPSEYVRKMYVSDGVPQELVQVVPNGVDLEVFSPAGENTPAPSRTRFLFVGGLISRKGPDVLLHAFTAAFAGRDDVELVIKDFGADGIYRGGLREPFRAHIESGALPHLELITDDLSTEDLVSLYRSADALVHPYRGEGFAMPVLEAMACGLPVIVTAGGPTDEFCPPHAGWRIRSSRKELPAEQLGSFIPADTPWMLEPDPEHLIELLREAASDADGRRRRGAAARVAAQALSWDTVAARYRDRITRLARMPPKLAGPPHEPFPLSEPPSLRVLATPAWAGEDALELLLRDWSAGTTPETDACLYLLADPSVAGESEAVEAHVLEAAARGGADLEACADIEILFEPFRPDRDTRLHAAVNAYVPLHPGCAGQVRYAGINGNRIFHPDTVEFRGALTAAG